MPSDPPPDPPHDLQKLQDLCKQALSKIQLPPQKTPVVRSLIANNGKVSILLDLPPKVALRRTIIKQIRQHLQALPGLTDLQIGMADQISPVATLPKNENTLPDSTPRAKTRNTYLQNYRHVITVGSGKGGVGKSTIATNLALALQHFGNRVSIFDADIYGPSLPIMLGLKNQKPELSEQQRIQPLRAYGLSVLSIGNLIEQAAATIWRGPIIHKVIEQLLRDTDWPGGDFMVIDMPPGTGDAPLTLSQIVQLSGAVMVSTPQDVALSDALKAITMFEKISVPVLGMVENMSSFICPHCQTESPIFDSQTVQKACHQQNIPFLGRIPIDLALRQSGDLGQPLLVNDLISSNAKNKLPLIQQSLLNIGREVLKQLEQQENNA